MFLYDSNGRFRTVTHLYLYINRLDGNVHSTDLLASHHISHIWNEIFVYFDMNTATQGTIDLSLSKRSDGETLQRWVLLVDDSE